jgi:hypothetical protein
MDSVYLLRHGATGRIVPARSDAGLAHEPARGDRVVAETPRGPELAEVLAPLARGLVPDEVPTRILRAATAADLEDAHAQAARAVALLPRCEAIAAEFAPGLAVVDVELLLDGETVVAYGLGDLPDDLPGARAAIRMRHGLDLILEPLGAGAGSGQEDEAAPASGGCGSCGTGGGCGPGGCGVRERIASWAAGRA